MHSALYINPEVSQVKWIYGFGVQESVSIEVIPEVIRLDEIIWEGLEGKPYFNSGQA